MKISKFEVFSADLALSRPYTIAYKTISTVSNVFCTLYSSDGHIGIGAASPSEMVTGENLSGTLYALKNIVEPAIHGQDLRHWPAILSALQEGLQPYPAAKAALDMALMDAWCRALGIRPLDYWGQHHQALPTSITIGIQSVEETLEQTREHLAQGFQCFKLKIGRGVEEDTACFRQLREVVGPNIPIRLDVNQGYHPIDLCAFHHANRHLGVEMYEQPFTSAYNSTLPEHDSVPRGAMAQQMIPRELRRLCAADEDLLTADDAINLVCANRAFGIFNIKLMKCGGSSEARDIAMVAERSGIQLMWGCNDESAASITAALHTALSCRATRYLDLDGSFDLAKDLVSGGFRLEKGVLYPLNEPGLGLALSF